MTISIASAVVNVQPRGLRYSLWKDLAEGLAVIVWWENIYTDPITDWHKLPWCFWVSAGHSHHRKTRIGLDICENWVANFRRFGECKMPMQQHTNSREC